MNGVEINLHAEGLSAHCPCRGCAACGVFWDGVGAVSIGFVGTSGSISEKAFLWNANSLEATRRAITVRVQGLRWDTPGERDA